MLPPALQGSSVNLTAGVPVVPNLVSEEVVKSSHFRGAHVGESSFPMPSSLVGLLKSIICKYIEMLIVLFALMCCTNCVSLPVYLNVILHIYNLQYVQW